MFNNSSLSKLEAKTVCTKTCTRYNLQISKQASSKYYVVICFSRTIDVDITSLAEYLNLYISRSKTAKTARNSCWYHFDSCWFYFCSKIIWLFQWVFVKINVKFEFLDLNYLYFDTKHICFGRFCSHGLQTAIYYEAASRLRSLFYNSFFRNGFVTEPLIGQ